MSSPIPGMPPSEPVKPSKDIGQSTFKKLSEKVNDFYESIKKLNIDRKSDQGAVISHAGELVKTLESDEYSEALKTFNATEIVQLNEKIEDISRTFNALVAGKAFKQIFGTNKTRKESEAALAALHLAQGKMSPAIGVTFEACLSSYHARISEGNPDEAEALLHEATRMAATLYPLSDRSDHLKKISVLCLNTPSLLPLGVSAAYQIPDPEMKSEALRKLCNKYIEVKDFKRAEGTAKLIPSEPVKLEILGRICSGYLEKKELLRAEDLALEISDANIKSKALREVCHARIKANNLSPIDLSDINFAKQIPDTTIRSEVLDSLCTTFCKNKKYDYALIAAKAIPVPLIRAKALVTLMPLAPKAIRDEVNKEFSNIIKEYASCAPEKKTAENPRLYPDRVMEFIVFAKTIQDNAIKSEVLDRFFTALYIGDGSQYLPENVKGYLKLIARLIPDPLMRVKAIFIDADLQRRYDIIHNTNETIYFRGDINVIKEYSFICKDFSDPSALIILARNFGWSCSADLLFNLSMAFLEIGKNNYALRAVEEIPDLHYRVGALLIAGLQGTPDFQEAEKLREQGPYDLSYNPDCGSRLLLLAGKIPDPKIKSAAFYSLCLAFGNRMHDLAAKAARATEDEPWRTAAFTFLGIATPPVGPQPAQGPSSHSDNQKQGPQSSAKPASTPPPLDEAAPAQIQKLTKESWAASRDAQLDTELKTGVISDKHEVNIADNEKRKLYKDFKKLIVEKKPLTEVLGFVRGKNHRQMLSALHSDKQGPMGTTSNLKAMTPAEQKQAINQANEIEIRKEEARALNQLYDQLWDSR